MGNYASCTLSIPLSKQSRMVTVVLPGGEVKQIGTPVKAAEIMLESPSNFLANSRSLQVGRRFSPLNADEDLEPANVYVMFPMKKANAVVAAADMGALFLAASKAAKRGIRGKVRVLPEDKEGKKGGDYDVWRENDAVVVEATEEEAAAPRLNLDDIEDFAKEEFMHRLSLSRSKKPLLETIAEEPVRVR